MKEQKINKSVVIFAVLVILISIANISMTLYKFAEYKNSISGHALGSGYVNVTVSTQITVNFSRDTINWGAGTITAGNVNATLTTKGETSTVVRGNWSTTNAKGLILANVGNVNSSLVLGGVKTGATFFGGSTPEYQWNISSKDTNSCVSPATLGAWADVNTSTKFCTQFGYLTDANELYVDILLTIPYDATLTGVQSDIITATASTAG